MFPLGLLALSALAGYQYSKSKQNKKDAERMLAEAQMQKNQTTTSSTDKTTAQNIYNYNYLNDSNTGNTLFDSQQKTKRTIFGNVEKARTTI